MQNLKRLICIFFVFLILVPVSNVHGLTTKMQGKLSLVFILFGIGVLTKYLIHSEQKKVDDLHVKLGEPERVVEYQKGFEHWRIEWYDGKKYKFRNGVLINE